MGSSFPTTTIKEEIKMKYWAMIDKHGKIVVNEYSGQWEINIAKKSPGCGTILGPMECDSKTAMAFKMKEYIKNRDEFLLRESW
jgi:hypothetical protein